MSPISSSSVCMPEVSNSIDLIGVLRPGSTMNWLKLLLKITVVPKNTTLSKDIQLDQLDLQQENNEVKWKWNEKSR